jgi:putative hydrolase of the HAD superfamily
MIKAIVFDIGGVLLRTDDRTSRIELENQYNLPPGASDQLVFDNPKSKLSSLGQADPSEIWQYVADSLSLTDQTLIEFEEHFWSGDRVDDALVRFIQDSRANYTTALLSNAWVDARQTFAEKYGLIEGEIVDYVLISAEIGLVKPDPRIYQVLAETIHHPFEEILFIDDFIENIRGAEDLGINTIHYQPGMDLLSRLKEVLQ